MILADTNESLQKNESLTQINQIEAFISLKASIDGLLIHGVNTSTEDLQNLITHNLMYTPHLQIR